MGYQILQYPADAQNGCFLLAILRLSLLHLLIGSPRIKAAGTVQTQDDFGQLLVLRLLVAFSLDRHLHVRPLSLSLYQWTHTVCTLFWSICLMPIVIAGADAIAASSWASLAASSIRRRLAGLDFEGSLLSMTAKLISSPNMWICVLRHLHQ